MTEPGAPRDTAATAALAERARAERTQLAYPDRVWTNPGHAASGEPVDDVIIVGAGQSGLGIYEGLRRDGIARIRLVDAAPAGREGVWKTFARMSTLRTPKILNGLDFGQPSLSVRSWYVARHGQAAWDGLHQIPRDDWADYLAWYRETLRIPVENGVSVTDVRSLGDGVVVDARTPDGPRSFAARTVVLATGYDGAGDWAAPQIVSDAVAAHLWSHSNGAIDFAALAGLRVGVIGHGASAFDNAASALVAGAASADLLFRRAALPRINPLRHVETAALMGHYPALSDETRWNIARFVKRVDQPPAESGYRTANSMPGFELHPASPLVSVVQVGETVHVTTPRRTFVFDHLICATGLRVQLENRPELQTLAPLITRWSQRRPDLVGASGAEDDALGQYPYLGPSYEFTSVAGNEWVSRVFAFSGLGFVSQGPHSTSISGHKHAIPRVVRGITQRLLIDEQPRILDDLAAFDTAELYL
jgi:cation diffusion facilitator CzcD-associated flavoprotein CzcO